MNRAVLNLSERHENGDGTVTYMWALADHHAIETVCFGRDTGPGQRLSTQTRCAVGCSPVRNLTADEIVDQATRVDQDMRARGIVVPWQSIALSGSGEPMLNYDNAVEAARRLYEWTDIETVSATTSGIVPRIYQLAEEPIYVRLHVSLHATDDETRRRLIPVGRRWSIAEIIEAARYHAQVQRRRVIVDYLVLDGINDSDDDARRLIDMLDPELFEIHFLFRSR